MICQIILGFFLLLSACSPHSPKEFEQEGQAVCEDLVELLQTISSREELLDNEALLKKKFESLVTLMVAAARVHEMEGQVEEVEQGYPFRQASHQLKMQLQRIYELEGGREIIERSQHEALVRLDSEQRSFQKRRERLPTAG